MLLFYHISLANSICNNVKSLVGSLSVGAFWGRALVEFVCGGFLGKGVWRLRFWGLEIFEMRLLEIWGELGGWSFRG